MLGLVALVISGGLPLIEILGVGSDGRQALRLLGLPVLMVPVPVIGALRKQVVRDGPVRLQLPAAQGLR